MLLYCILQQLAVWNHDIMALDIDRRFRSIVLIFSQGILSVRKERTGILSILNGNKMLYVIVF